jgi:hypothetical protein
VEVRIKHDDGLDQHDKDLVKAIENVNQRLQFPEIDHEPILLTSGEVLEATSQGP